MPTLSPTLRVGIDVGGTFTDVVVVEVQTRAIVARVKVPTTHAAPAGVAEGIVAGLRAVLALPGVEPARIGFIAHATTQATNALLEGDVAQVGIVGILGRFGWFERAQLRVPPIALGADAALAPAIAFVAAAALERGDEGAARRAVDALLARGAEAIVASEAFGVDAPQRERRVVTCARERGAAATAGHEVAGTYGLRARTRTAVVNAAILPRMERTSQVTARAVIEAGIAAPLMIMRSDGGVMDVAEVARRPILTMLSGPAAGIAGALLHENVTDGIFIEVGGTSADCSVIRRGQPQMRPARVGGHRTLLRTLDVRTLAIAGGSIPRFRRDALHDVGPRSAHIAALGYACFTPSEALEGATMFDVAPHPGDPGDYVGLALTNGSRITLTPTCAANLLGYVSPQDFAYGNETSARLAFAFVGARFGIDPEALARAMLECATNKLGPAIDELIADYELSRADVELVGGGGGAAALVPFAAEHLGLRHRLARDADVISPLGVALALVRDVVERTIVNPTAEDVVRVRREAFERVVAGGAAPELVEVTVEIDARRNLVRATASGASAVGADGSAGANRPVDTVTARERTAAAARALRSDSSRIGEVASVGTLRCYRASEYGSQREHLCVVDERGIVRLIARRARASLTTVERCEPHLGELLEEMTSFGDVGRALPDVHLAYGGRLADLGTLAEVRHVVALAMEELRGLEPAAPVLIVASRRAA